MGAWRRLGGGGGAALALRAHRAIRRGELLELADEVLEASIDGNKVLLLVRRGRAELEHGFEARAVAVDD